MRNARLTAALLVGRMACSLSPSFAASESHLPAQPQAPFTVVEATIADIHAAMRANTLTCRALVDAYLARIAAYDKRSWS